MTPADLSKPDADLSKPDAESLDTSDPPELCWLHKKSLDSAHGKIREIGDLLGRYGVRLEKVESDVTRANDRLVDQREAINEIRADSAVTRHELAAIKQDTKTMSRSIHSIADRLEEVLQSLNGHVHEETLSYARQTQRIESVGRKVVMLIALVSGLLITATAIHQQITGANVLDVVAKMLGLVL